ncbi:MAG: GNAT family N-acetyltransferase [Clostridia bacterium]|nr:GNAT family N-acetyltransferase [Clostridia bacterium]
MQIRTAKFEDLHAIVQIYNQAVETKKSTADLTQVEVSDKVKWFYEHESQKHPIYVCEINGIICGWISLSPYRQGREALRYTVELSYYVDSNHQKKGIGTRMIEYIIRKCPELNIKTIFAIVLEFNEASIKLLKKFKFERWGYLPKVADFDGEECGHLYYGLRVSE